MKIFLFAAVFTLFLNAQPRYSQIRIPVRSTADMQQLTDLGIAADHFEGKVGSYIDLYVNEYEIDRLQNHHIPFTVLIADWNEYYNRVRSEPQSAAAAPTSVPPHFRYGSMGGFLTLAEVVQQIDSMHLLYPSLVSAKDSIGHTIEGRSIYALKISDNPSVHESNEPEVLFTALHHAREPEGMMTVIYFMWWLLENYGNEPEATYLVNNRQLWFIPVVNPDGYVYNQTTNPGGGGMHRKNRREVGSVNKGVDLNRNYGPFFMWNSSNIAGSSDDVNNETYRGASPFSEPETEAVKNFMANHDFKTCLNYHTYGNYLIYPWGYSSGESNDSLQYRYWSFAMAQHNRYSIGTDMQTVGYSTRGNSDDFMFSDSGKAKTVAMTPEVGTTGFWPSQNEIIPLAQENVLQNTLAAHYAGSLMEVFSFERNHNTIQLELINSGIAPSSASTLYCSSPNSIVSPSIEIPPAASFEKKKVSIAYSALRVDGPSAARVTVFLTDSIGAMANDSITFIAGNPVTVFSDSAASTSLWTTGNGWGVTSDLSGPNTFFTDSPNGHYLPNANNALTLKSPIDLSGYDFAELTFRTKWDIESTWDFATVEVSTNSGVTWNSLHTRMSRKGSGRNGSKQPKDSFGYDAFTPGLDWTTQTADLTPYCHGQILLRFRLASDGSMERDGWYVDDIAVLGYLGSPNGIPDGIPPVEFSLSQNFPNPFNPATAIGFSLDRNAQTSLIIYNLLGQTIETIFDQPLSPGKYSIIFDAKKLSSGIYFYRLTAGNRTVVRKMNVIK